VSNFFSQNLFVGQKGRGNHRKNKQKLWFLKLWFLKVIGAIDGTHIKIVPRDHNDSYINRKE